MQSIEPTYRTVAGQTLGTAYTAHLSPGYIFKGKLRAAATRSKFHDSADLRWLEQHFNGEIRPLVDGFDLRMVGLALKRYPELEYCFSRLGMNIARAKDITSAVNLSSLPPPRRGDVQNGLLRSG